MLTIVPPIWSTASRIRLRCASRSRTGIPMKKPPSPKKASHLLEKIEGGSTNAPIRQMRSKKVQRAAYKPAPRFSRSLTVNEPTGLITRFKQPAGAGIVFTGLIEHKRGPQGLLYTFSGFDSGQRCPCGAGIRGSPFDLPSESGRSRKRLSKG